MGYGHQDWNAFPDGRERNVSHRPAAGETPVGRPARRVRGRWEALSVGCTAGRVNDSDEADGR
ncbi:hypothetical protein FRAHR75_410035 [Frankia sp. Hr75.2]|nr:hypothetical protein FRAHR75_410035 [Frankia sp. Hr75.2]